MVVIYIAGVALEILGINEQLVIKWNHEGTALHVLAGQRFYKTSKTIYIPGNFI